MCICTYIHRHMHKQIHTYIDIHICGGMILHFVRARLKNEENRRMMWTLGIKPNNKNKKTKQLKHEHKKQNNTIRTKTKKTPGHQPGHKPGHHQGHDGKPSGTPVGPWPGHQLGHHRKTWATSGATGPRRDTSRDNTGTTRGAGGTTTATGHGSFKQ